MCGASMKFPNFWHLFIPIVVADTLVSPAVLMPDRASPLRTRHGSLVIGLVSKDESYMVIGAESRNSSEFADLEDDSACKVISIGDAIFF
jgi:hypothetical protein